MTHPEAAPARASDTEPVAWVTYEILDTLTRKIFGGTFRMEVYPFGHGVPLYTAAALATARAEGRAEGMREAAGIASRWLEEWSHDLFETWEAYVEAKTTGKINDRRIAANQADLYASQFRERAEAVHGCVDGVEEAILAALSETKAP